MSADKETSRSWKKPTAASRHILFSTKGDFKKLTATTRPRHTEEEVDLQEPLLSLSPEQTNLKLTSRAQAPGICLETDHNAENKTKPDRRAVNQSTPVYNQTRRLAEYIQQVWSPEHSNLKTKGTSTRGLPRNSPQRRQQDYTKMYGLQELRNRLYTRSHDKRNILEGIETPIGDKSQEDTNKEHIRGDQEKGSSKGKLKYF